MFLILFLFLFYGYGVYGYVIFVVFFINRLLLVDCGFVYVIVYIRGGKDKGDVWYWNGKLGKKENMFMDFIVLVYYLISEGYIVEG